MSNTATGTESGLLTELVFILDRSGSMGGLEADTIGGFNSMLRSWKQKELPVVVTTVLFDHEYELLHDRVPIAQIRELGSDKYFVRGSTALYDAVGRSIEHVNMVHRYIRQEDRPAHTVFVVTTDGYENASRRFTRLQVSKLVADMRKKDWEFIFIGADLDADEVADHLDVDRAMVFHAKKSKTFHLYSTIKLCMEKSLMENCRATDAFRDVHESSKSRSGRKRSGK